MQHIAAERKASIPRTAIRMTLIKLNWELSLLPDEAGDITGVDPVPERAVEVPTVGVAASDDTVPAGDDTVAAVVDGVPMDVDTATGVVVLLTTVIAGKICNSTPFRHLVMC